MTTLDPTQPQKVWNNGHPVWNKGRAMKPPVESRCPHCNTRFLLVYGSAATRSKIYRLKLGIAVYCSEICRRASIRKKISQALIGHSVSARSIARSRETAQRTWTDPVKRARIIAANTGKVVSKETREKKRRAWHASEVSKAHLLRIQTEYVGAKSPQWKGGITPVHRLIRASVKMKNWRRTVLGRDDYCCQTCGKRGGNLCAHHLKPFYAHPELRFDVSNGQTLCKPCHFQTDTYGRPTS